MNWRLEKACSFTVSSGGEGIESGVRLCLAAALLDRLCVGLCLLREGLIDSLDLVSAEDSRQTFRLQRAERITSIALRNGKVALALNENELKRWVCFALRTVRDGGVAEVDHLDVEAAAADEHFTETTTVVVMFPSPAPVPSDQARRLLGL